MIFIYFSEFAQIIQPLTTLSANKSEFVVKLFRSVGSTFFSDYEDDYARKLFNGQSGKRIFRISATLRNTIPNPFDIKGATNFFKSSIINNKYNQLFDIFNISDKYPKDNDILIFSLALMFQEYCSKDEKDITTSVSKIYSNHLLEPVNKDFDYLDLEKIEVLNNICPLCKKNKLVKPKSLKNYEIVNIYPEKCDAFLKNYINQIEPSLNQVNNEQNKILLCKKCAKEYETNPTSNLLKKLIDIRDNLSKKIASRPDDDLDMYDSIKSVIDKLLEIKNPNKLTELSYNALKIKDKISEDSNIFRFFLYYG